MAHYKVRDPQGNERVIEGPDGATDEEIVAQAQRLFPTQTGGAAPPTAPRPLSTMKPGISPEAVAPGSGVGAHLARFLLQPVGGGASTGGEEPIPAQRGKNLFGPAAATRAMEEELAARNFGGKAEAGVGTALDDAALRLKEATSGLTPEEQQAVEFNRQIKGTAGGALGNVGGNIAMLGPLARGATAAGEAVLPAAVKRLATAFPKTAAVVAPAAGGAAALTATQPTLPGESEAAQAGIGAAGGVLGKGVVTALPAVLSGAKALLGQLAPEGTKITREAVRALTDAMQRDGLDPVAVLARANELSTTTGKSVSLADIVGSDVAAVNTQKVLQTALNAAPGEVRAPVSRGLIEKAKGQSGRITEDLAAGLGGSKTQKSEVFDAIAKAKTEEAGPLYEAAFANKTPVVDPRLDAIGDRPSMVAALKKVDQDALERGEPVEGPYTTKNLDMAKKKLYDMEDSLRRAGQNSDAAAIGNTRRQLTAILDDAAPPEYQQARKIWGDYAEMKTQFENGMDVFKSDPAAITKAVDAAAPAERQAFVSGIVAKVNEMPSKEGLDWAGNTLLRDVNKMAKLRAAFGSAGEDAFQAFKASLEAESMALRSSKLYPPKGVTYAHAAGQTPGELAATAVDLTHGGVGSALMKALKYMSGRGLSEKGSGKLSQMAFGAPGSLDPMASKALALPGGQGGAGALPPEAGLVGPLEMLRLKQQHGP